MVRLPWCRYHRNDGGKILIIMTFSARLFKPPRQEMVHLPGDFAAPHKIHGRQRARLM
jgi:hypothetical protein